jgi:branched-chain amino acid transport system permease protein
MRAGRWGQPATWIGLGLLVVSLLAPFWLNSYWLFVLGLFWLNLVAALGLNMVMGYAGLVSLGHAGFAAVGAYTTALLTVHLGVSYWVAVTVGAVVAGVVGFLIGLPALRLRPLYLAMVTFSFGQVVVLIVLNWLPVTHGPNGLRIPPPALGGLELETRRFHYVVVIASALLVLVGRNIIDSRLGRAFLALRESEVAARAIGVNVAQTKTTAFALSAVYAGLAGGLYLGLAQFINPDAFVFGVSITYLTMNVIGGMGTIAGSVIGSAIFTLLPEVLRGFTTYREFISGALLLTFLIFVPGGMVSLVPRLAALGRADRRMEQPEPEGPADVLAGEPRVG